MLEKHLSVKTNPLANKDNIIINGKFRITVITERLFRIEIDDKKTFCDNATACIWYRDLGKVEKEVIKGKTFIQVKTFACELYLADDIARSYVVLNGKKVKLDNKGNLLGTFRTLDQCDGDTLFTTNKQIELCNGVVSKRGVAVLNDDSCILNDDGLFTTRTHKEQDFYVFAYGTDYKQAVKDFLAISGQTPMLPRYVLGNWWSRYYVYNEKSYLSLLDKFAENSIPLTVATIDMDWHYSTTLDKDFEITKSGKNTDYYGGNDGWTGYSWNKELFPDYKRLLRKVKDRNLKITLNLHPALGIRWFEDCYKDFATAMGIDPESQQVIKFDLTNEKFIKNYFEIIHNPYEKDGVDFWWIDWQQGNSSAKKGVDPLLLLNHYHYLDAKKQGNPVILSRFCGAGAQRYPLGFSGDTLITWKTLDYLPYFTATASNIGYGWWSHDIGGHFFGEKCDELYLRSVQYGVFSPILRLHCCNDKMMSKEPWYYPNGIGELTAKALRLRHSLIPFLYSLNYKCHTQGEMLVEPLYYYYPEKAQAYKYKNEYFFGGLLVAPITTPSQNGLSSVKVWFPEGKWTDIFTGEVFEGEREVTVYRYLDSIPVFAREGAVIVKSKDAGNSIENPEKLSVEIFNGNGEFVLYEDTPSSTSETIFRTHNDGQKQYVTINHIGANSTDNRNIELLFKNIQTGSVQCYCNERLTYGCVSEGDCIKVELNNYIFENEYIVEVEYANFSKLKYVKDRAFSIIAKMQGKNQIRNELYDKIKKCEKIEDIEKEIQSSPILPIYKKYLLSY